MATGLWNIVVLNFFRWAFQSRTFDGRNTGNEREKVGLINVGLMEHFLEKVSCLQPAIITCLLPHFTVKKQEGEPTLLR